MFRPQDVERIKAYAEAVELPAVEDKKQGKLFQG
jgi:hypothetical protein